MIDHIAREAQRRNADALVFASQSQDPKKNPIPFREKVTYLRQLFPNVEFSASTAIRTPFDALAALSENGYEDVTVLVGTDRVAEFEGFAKYISMSGPKSKYIRLKKYSVIAHDVPRTDGVSASVMRKLAVEGDQVEFVKRIPTKNKTLAKQIYQSVRRHMGINESRNLARRVLAILREAAGTDKPKSDVDKLKDRQKQELIMTKERQANQILQAKQTELQQKSREAIDKLKHADEKKSNK